MRSIAPVDLIHVLFPMFCKCVVSSPSGFEIFVYYLRGFCSRLLIHVAHEYKAADAEPSPRHASAADSSLAGLALYLYGVRLSSVASGQGARAIQIS